jgi:hypothetical protein
VTMTGCPICGVEPEIHDRVYVGQQCNLRKPLLRVLVPFRKQLIRLISSIDRSIG